MIVENTPVVLLCGPSGTGKSTTVRVLEDYGYSIVPSTKFREPYTQQEAASTENDFRPQEAYWSLDRGDILTDNTIFGAHYCYLRSTVHAVLGSGTIPVFIVQTRTVYELASLFTKYHAIFLMPESSEIIQNRMLTRLGVDSTDQLTPAQLSDFQARLLDAQQDLYWYVSHGAEQYFHDAIVVSPSLSPVQVVSSVLQSFRARIA